MRDIFQNNIPNGGMRFILLFTLKQEVISSSKNAVGKKKILEAVLRAWLIFSLICRRNY